MKNKTIKNNLKKIPVNSSESSFEIPKNITIPHNKSGVSITVDIDVIRHHKPKEL